MTVDRRFKALRRHNLIQTTLLKAVQLHIQQFTMQAHQPKTSLWGKMRSSTKQLSSSLANLSLRTEHDGDTEENTLIHKALVNRYLQASEPFPEWLGVSAQQQQQLQHGQQQQQQQQQQHSSHRQHQQPQSAPSSGTRTSASSGSVADKYRRAPASSSFKDIYNRTPANPAPQQHSAPLSTRPMWGQTDSNGAMSAQSAQSEDRGSAMKGRLKRNNYRTNFGV